MGCDGQRDRSDALCVGGDVVKTRKLLTWFMLPFPGTPTPLLMNYVCKTQTSRRNLDFIWYVLFQETDMNVLRNYLWRPISFPVFHLFFLQTVLYYYYHYFFLSLYIFFSLFGISLKLWSLNFPGCLRGKMSSLLVWAFGVGLFLFSNTDNGHHICWLNTLWLKNIIAVYMKYD